MAALNVEQTHERLLALHRFVTTHRASFGDAPAVCIANGRHVEGDTLTACVHFHLLEFEFTDTVIAFLPEKIVVLVSAGKKLAMLEPVAARRGPVPIELVGRNKKEDPSGKVFETVAAMVKAAVGDAPAGVVATVEAGDEFLTAWATALRNAHVATVDARTGVEESLLVKDAVAQDNLVFASKLTERLSRWVFIESMEDNVDKKKPITHAQLAAEIVAAMGNLEPGDDDKDKKKSSSSKKKSRSFLDEGMAVEKCELGTQPLVQSGGRYTLELRDATSDTRPLTPDTILFSVGARYSGHHAFCARTYFINPSPRQEEAYTALVEIYDRLRSALVPGVVIGDVAREIQTKLAAVPALEGATFPTSFGSGTGTLQREGLLEINERNRRRVEAGMSFAVVLAVGDIAVNAGGADGKRFAVALADTILVESLEGLEPGKLPTRVLTQKLKHELGDVRYELSDETSEEEEDDEDDDDDDDDGKKKKGKKDRAPAFNFDSSVGRDRDGRSARLKARAAEGGQAPEEVLRKRAEHQFELRTARAREARERIARGESASADSTVAREIKPIHVYNSASEFPSAARPNQIYVDKAREAVLLPIMGQLVPFHISAIKSVQKSEEGAKTEMRLTFYTPGSAPGKDCAPVVVQALKGFPEHVWFKTLTFSSKKGSNINTQVMHIKEVQRILRQRENDSKEEHGLVEQPRLLVDTKSKVARLQRLSMWPTLSGRKSVGSLEVHVNGLLFHSDRGETVEIIYSNIKHAIFQPCRGEHNVTLHFRLKHPILIAKKKRLDVQFFTEVIEASETLEGHRRSVYDPDELDEEQRERELRNTLNRAFAEFVDRVQMKAQVAPTPVSLRFEEPERKLGFYGTHDRENVYIMPCSDCLVSISEKPPLVVSIDDIMHVHFERVISGLKSFEMTIILKEGRAEKGEPEFVHIGMIPIEYKEPIQQWLDEVVEITFTESRISIDWKKIMPVIRDESFFEESEDGKVGFEIFIEDDGEDEEDDEEASTDYDEDEDDEDEDEDDDEDFSDAVTSEDDDDDDDEDEDDEDDGEDWEELEKRARDDDRARYREEVEEEDAAERRKRKGAPAPAKGGKSSATPAKRSRN